MIKKSFPVFFHVPLGERRPVAQTKYKQSNYIKI